VVEDAWYRSTAWDAEAQIDFETRLARAREWKRPQYLRIKGLAVSTWNEEAAEALFQRVIEAYPDKFDASSCQEHLGDLWRKQGKLAEAERAYRAVLEQGNGLSPSGTSGCVNISLAELLIQADCGREMEALAQLELLVTAGQLRGSLGHFNDVRFRWEVALAVATDRLGQRENSERAAERALNILDAPDPFSRHPGVGKAHADEATVRMLRDLVRPKGKKRILRRTHKSTD
jgi:tetratricopeptide (TPR) repeat protein